MNTRKLAVIDVDETLIEWDGFRSAEPRSCAYEFLDFLSGHPDLDMALFSTANIRYVRWIKDHYFGDYEFIQLLGEEHIQYHEGRKVKNLSLFMNRYDLKNVILIDDKPRNARLQPDMYVEVKPPSYYRKKNRFDDELIQIQQKVKMLLRL